MVQTSLFISQVWSGNMDVKPLLYQSDPSNPDPEDIVTFSGYMVGYHMKGEKPGDQEKNMKDLFMNMEDMYGNKELTGPRLT
jgi:hypothetical protein